MSNGEGLGAAPTDDITKISKTDFLALPVSQQVKYVDPTKFNRFVDDNTTRDYLTGMYGGVVANEIMNLNVPNKERIKISKKYQSQNQIALNTDFNDMYLEMDQGEGFYPIGEQEAYGGSTSQDYYDKYSTFVNTYNSGEQKAFYDNYSKLQKLETDKYKAEVKVAKDIDAVNKDFHTDVEKQFERLGKFQESKDVFDAVVWQTESLFGGDTRDQTIVNLDLQILVNKLSDDSQIYMNPDSQAFINQETGEYQIPNLTSMKEYERLFNRIINDPKFSLPEGNDQMASLISDGDPEMYKFFLTGNPEQRKLAFKNKMIDKIVSARKFMLGEIPLSVLGNDAFNDMIRQTWSKEFQATELDPFAKFKKENDE